MNIKTFESILSKPQLKVIKEWCEDPITEDYIQVDDKRVELYSLHHFDVLDDEEIFEEYGEELILSIFKSLKDSGADYFIFEEYEKYLRRN